MSLTVAVWVWFREKFPYFTSGSRLAAPTGGDWVDNDRVIGYSRLEFISKREPLA
jgi:hypothetical protein